MNTQVLRANPAQLFTPDGFCHVVKAPLQGDLIFISGQVSYDENGEVVGVGDIAAQTQRIFENLETILETVGASLTDVVKYTFYVKNMDSEQIQKIRQVRSQFIDKDALPTSTMVGISALAKEELLLEVEAYALVVPK